MHPLRWIPALLAAGLALIPSTGSAQYAPGKGSLGATLGVPLLYSTGELRLGQRPRLMGKVHFQYVFTPSWRASLRAGFGWLGHTAVPAPFVLLGGDATRVDQLDTFVPVTGSLVYTRDLTAAHRWKIFGGGGPGLYRVNLLNDRHTFYDPVTHKRFRFLSPGVNGELGTEYFLAANRNVSFEWLGTIHYLLKANRDEFPSGYSGHYGFYDLSFGVNVYFKTGLGEGEPTLPEPKTEAKPEAAPSDSVAAPTQSPTSPPGNP